MFNSLKRAISDMDAEKDGDLEHCEPLDWMSETFQLICREYRQSLGLVDPNSFESRHETESEHRYWSELYRVRGCGIYEGRRHYHGQEVILEIIPDPPADFVMSWLSKNDVQTQNSEAESPEQYQERLQAWELRFGL
jgi:hypothetical protein